MSSDPNFEMHVSASAEGATIIALSGSITESTELAPPEELGAAVTLECSRVERINSMGVRKWLQFMKQLQSRGPTIVVKRLSPALVIQASMISGFLGGARVESFLAPYFCPSCEHSTDPEFAIADQPPSTIPCPKCGAAMEFDSEADAYLGFRL